MTAERRVVVTGLGATTPVGGNVPDTWDAILAGKSGARTMPYAWVEQYDLPGLKTDERGIAEIQGVRGAWFKDPDGNVLVLHRRFDA